MPQLDKVTFLSQFFWLVVIYVGFFLSIQKIYLPRFGRIFKYREKQISTIDTNNKTAGSNSGIAQISGSTEVSGAIGNLETRDSEPNIKDADTAPVATGGGYVTFFPDETGEKMKGPDQKFDQILRKVSEEFIYLVNTYFKNGERGAVKSGSPSDNFQSIASLFSASLFQLITKNRLSVDPSYSEMSQFGWGEENYQSHRSGDRDLFFHFLSSGAERTGEELYL